MIRNPRLCLLAALALTVPHAVAASNLACEDHAISAGAVQTRADVPRFVQCAYEFAMEVGFEEAKRAFHEDPRWFSGEVFIFVDSLAPSGDDSVSLVYPPDPSNEGKVWGAYPSFGNDLTAEQYRIATMFGRGWMYYEAGSHVTNLRDRKATYLIRMNWDGHDAAIASGIYPLDIPGNCRPSQVNASALDEAPSDPLLEAFVNCAARRVEAAGYFAKTELERSPRWTGDSVYVFALDLMGNQVFSGNGIRVNGKSLHEFGGKSTQRFLGRDVITIGDVFGETYLQYIAMNPHTGRMERKVAYMKRVLAQGTPILVGAGYYLSDTGP